jgi:Cyclin, C-terminal domain
MTYSGYDPDSVSSVARQIVQTFESRTPTCFKVVTKKYKTHCYGGVASLALPDAFPTESSL